MSGDQVEVAGRRLRVRHTSSGRLQIVDFALDGFEGKSRYKSVWLTGRANCPFCR
jgi:hypothetical protein